MNMEQQIVLAAAGVAVAVLFVPALCLCILTMVAPHLPSLQNKRICLLIAHSDDEAMFFAPTLLALTRPENRNRVRILCLSSGDAEGLGQVRKRELVRSGLMLGLKSREDILVVDNPT